MDKSKLAHAKKSQAVIALGAVGLWLPQSLGAAFLYAFYTTSFHSTYGNRGYITSTLEAIQGAVLGTPAAFAQALAEYPFYTVLLATGLLGLNALHQWKREPQELTLLSMLAFVAMFLFIFSQRLA